MNVKPKSIDFFDLLAIAGSDDPEWPQWLMEWARGGPGRWEALHKLQHTMSVGYPVSVGLMDKIVQSVNKWLSKP